MLIREESIGHYVERLKSGYHFSVAGYSDAEWYCILGEREGQKTGLGQIISSKHGEILADILQRRQRCERFWFAIPKCLYQLPGMAEGQIDWFLGRNNIRIEAHERDMVTDDLAREAKLYPFINQLQKMNIVMIGNKHLRGMQKYLDYKHFVEISSPNLHMEDGGIEKAVESAVSYGKPAVYLVSAGVSAAVIVDKLFDEIPNSWFLDCGSIWDAFVGIGEQRAWRAELYQDKKRHKQWIQKNLHG